MTHVLHLDSSARSAGSVTRLLGRELVTAWRAADPATTVTYRDLDADPPSFVNDTWVSGAFRAPAQRDSRENVALVRSDRLIGELEAADVVVVGAPMYNFGVPAALKAWIDQVVRIDRTFGYDGPTPVGLVHGKRVVVLASSGGDAAVYEQYGLDFRTSYLRAILGFIGITDVDVVSVTGTAAPAADLDAARAELAGLRAPQPAPA